MADSGWDIAMRRIDREYDLPQFVASSLVRKIAANQFRLPVTDRNKFAQLPDHVIERIEQIVRDAYLEAGDNAGGDILREHLGQQALVARREMVVSEELILEDAFRERLGVTPERLSKLLADGSIFAIEVDGVEYYPALLAEAGIDRNRLQSICRILVPARPEYRLDFLSSPRGSLGSRTPLEMLDVDDDFKRLQQVVAAWAAEAVPDDFPWDPTPALLSGTQPKLAGRMINGRFVVGLTAEERYIRWDLCEDLAQQLVPKTLKDAAKFPMHSHDDTLRRMRRAIERKGWVERLETDWLMDRLRGLLGW